jgi:hypothetical protein
MAHRNAHTYQWQRYRVENQNTQPVPSGNLPFRLYLSAHHLTTLDVARLAGVRYATTWRIEQNKPIRLGHAALVRAVLYRATGVVYTGPIAVYSDESSLCM